MWRPDRSTVIMGQTLSEPVTEKVCDAEHFSVIVSFLFFEGPWWRVEMYSSSNVETSDACFSTLN